VKRVMFVLICSLAIGAVLFGGGSKEGAVTDVVTSEKTSLRLLTNWGSDDPKGPILQGIIDDFEKTNPTIDIVVNIASDTDIPTLVETSFLGHKEPDIIMHMLKATSIEWVKDGVAVSLNQYVKDWGLEKGFLPNTLKEYTVDGTLVAFPLEGFNWPMWYRKDVLQKSGLSKAPETYADLIKFAETARLMDLQPFALGGSDWTGGDWFDTSLASMLSPEELCALMKKGGWSQNAKVVSFIKQFVQLRDKGVFIDNVAGQTFETMNAAFFSGKAGAMHGGSWSYAELPDEMQNKVVLGGIPLPVGAYYKKPVEWSAFDAKGVFISRNGLKKIDAVKLFVTFLYAPKNIARFVNKAGMISPLKSTPIDETILKPIFVQSLSVDFEPLTNPTKCAPSSIDGEPWYQIVSGFYVTGTSVKKILSEMDKVYELVE